MALLPPALAHARCFCPTENSQPVHSDPLKSLLQPDGPGQAQMATAHQIACMVYYRAGCEFSRVQTLLTLAIVEAKSGSRVWCRQKNTRHAEAVWRMKCA